MLQIKVRAFLFDPLISAMRSLCLYQAISTVVVVPGISIRRRLGEVDHSIDLWHFIDFACVHEATSNISNTIDSVFIAEIHNILRADTLEELIADVLLLANRYVFLATIVAYLAIFLSHLL